MYQYYKEPNSFPLAYWSCKFEMKLYRWAMRRKYYWIRYVFAHLSRKIHRIVMYVKTLRR